MLTGVSVAQTAAVGTVVGYLHCYDSGLTVPSAFQLTVRATGLFAIETTASGPRW